MNSISLFAYSLKISWARSFKYGKHKILAPLSVFIRESWGVIWLFCLCYVAGPLGGWSFYELLFLQSMISISYAFLLLFFTGIREFKTSSQNKKLDMALLKPRGVLFQILLSEVDCFAIVGHGALGLCCFVVGNLHCDVNYNIEKVVILILNLIGAVAIQAAIWLFMTSLGFFTRYAFKLKELLFWMSRCYLQFPLIYFPAFFGKLFVFVIPFAFVSYFPTLHLLGRADAAYPHFFQYCSLPIGVAVYLLSYLLWRVGLKRYRLSC